MPTDVSLQDLAAEAARLKAENKFLRSVIEAFPGGVIAYNKYQQVIVCSEKQKELLEYPPYLFEFGMPSLEQVVRCHAKRGEYGKGDIDDLVQHRLGLAGKREAHRFVRRLPNGSVVEVRGDPLPDGGFVTQYFECDGKEVIEQPLRLTDAALQKRVMSELEFLEKLEYVVTSPHLRKVSAVHSIEVLHHGSSATAAEDPVHQMACRAIEQRLLQSLRGSDIVARIGSTFAILQFGIERPSDVTRLQLRVAEACKTPVASPGIHVNADTRLGVALFPRDGTNALQLMNKARYGQLGTAA
jgi:hypothetical protein